MSRRRNFMSEQLKNELAKDLGIYDTVQREGWGGIKAKDAGNMVKRAIQMAEQAAAKQFEQAQPPAQTQFQDVRKPQQPAQTQFSSMTTAQPVQQPAAYRTHGQPLSGQTTASVVPPYMQPAAQSQPPVQYRQ